MKELNQTDNQHGITWSHPLKPRLLSNHSITGRVKSALEAPHRNAIGGGRVPIGLWRGWGASMLPCFRNGVKTGPACHWKDLLPDAVEALARDIVACRIQPWLILWSPGSGSRGLLAFYPAQGFATAESKSWSSGLSCVLSCEKNTSLKSLLPCLLNDSLWIWSDDSFLKEGQV